MGYSIPVFNVIKRVLPLMVTVQLSPTLCDDAGMHSGLGMPGGGVSYVLQS
jgi:hypothetical protein